MVRIFVHGAAYDRELVDAPCAQGGGCLAAENYSLWQLGIVLLIFVRPVVESRYIHHGGHVVVYHGIRCIHTLCDRSGRVFPVADVLEHQRELGTAVPVPLVRHLIADAPHDYARVVAEMAQEVDKVFFRPFVEHLVVSVLYFCRSPFVERFGHEHHSHFVACFHQFRGRHIVGCPYGVASHVLEDAYLPSDAGFVGDASQRTEVMVVADSAEDYLLPVEEEALAVDYLRSSYSEDS